MAKWETDAEAVKRRYREAMESKETEKVNQRLQDAALKDADKRREDRRKKK